MKKIDFSADGIRGLYGKWPLTSKGIHQLGAGLGIYLRQQHGTPRVILGVDTRLSSSPIAQILSSELDSNGVSIAYVGIAPTPAIAYITRHSDAIMGISISASHNPSQFNGIKLIQSNGLRLAEKEEKILAQLITDARPTLNTNEFELDKMSVHGLLDEYLKAQIEGFDNKKILASLTIVLDCANGATSKTAPHLFKALGAKVHVVNYDVEHGKINQDCGSEQARLDPQYLIELVKSNDAQYGFAFDGDGDRVVIVDCHGCSYNGDDLLYVLAKHYAQNHRLHGNRIVTTEIANSGLRTACARHGINLTITRNGDRNLEREIWGSDESKPEDQIGLGGEQVGNIILNDGNHAAADSVYVSLLLCSMLESQKVELVDLVKEFEKHPQMLARVLIAENSKTFDIAQFDDIKNSMLKILGEESRINIWSSSTEKGTLNVMIEAGLEVPNQQVQDCATTICSETQRKIGAEPSRPILLDLSTRCPFFSAKHCQQEDL